MKSWLLIPLLISAIYCAAADKPTPPDAYQVLRVFFDNINAPLKNEPFCQVDNWLLDVKEGDDPRDPKYRAKTLSEYVISQIGGATELWQEDNDSELRRVSILTWCRPELYHEVPLIDSDKTIKADYWACYVTFRESMVGEPWVAQVEIGLFIKPDLSGFIPGTLRCLD